MFENFTKRRKNMKQRTANRISAISPSLTLAISAKAKAMKEAGESVVSFGVGEPDFNTPENIIQAAKTALDNGYTKYTPSSGLLTLRKAICDKLKRENGLEYQPSQIIVSNGAKHSIFNACYALLNEGDEVIIPAPYWLTYPEVVKVCGGVPKYIECSKENKFKFTLQQLKDAITPKTKMLIFNSPSNPTGAVYTEEEVRAIAKVCDEA
jgi:aspartate aminotransferase